MVKVERGKSKALPRGKTFGNGGQKRVPVRDIHGKHRVAKTKLHALHLIHEATPSPSTPQPPVSRLFLPCRCLELGNSLFPRPPRRAFFVAIMGRFALAKPR